MTTININVSQLANTTTVHINISPLGNTVTTEKVVTDNVKEVDVNLCTSIGTLAELQKVPTREEVLNSERSIDTLHWESIAEELILLQEKVSKSKDEDISTIKFTSGTVLPKPGYLRELTLLIEESDALEYNANLSTTKTLEQAKRHFVIRQLMLQNNEHYIKNVATGLALYRKTNACEAVNLASIDSLIDNLIIYSAFCIRKLLNVPSDENCTWEEHHFNPKNGRIIVAYSNSMKDNEKILSDAKSKYFHKQRFIESLKEYNTEELQNTVTGIEMYKREYMIGYVPKNTLSININNVAEDKVTILEGFAEQAASFK